MNLQIELKNVSEELDMVKNEMEDLREDLGHDESAHGRSLVRNNAGRVIQARPLSAN